MEIKEIATDEPESGSNVEENGAVVPAQPSDDNGEVVQNPQQVPPPSTFENFMAITKSLIVRALIFYFITSLFRRQTTPAVDPSKAGVRPNAGLPCFNLFDNGTVMDMYVYVTESEKFSDFGNEHALIWQQERLVYGDWYGGPDQDGTLTKKIELETSEAVQNNGSIYLHVFFTKAGYKPHMTEHTSYSVKQLNRFKRRRYQKTKNLLTGETSASPEVVLKAKTMKEEIVSHWHPNLTINFVTDQTHWVQGSVPSPFDEYIQFSPDGKTYKPVVYFNDYWNMLRDYQPINETTKNLTLYLTYQPLSLFKWQLYSVQSMRNKWGANYFGDTFNDFDNEDQDSLKEALLETPLYLLLLTGVVSILHSIFELLAFKNDIQFWNNRKSLEGLSVRSVFFNVFQSLIVLLYVLDNDTNTIIRLSVGVGLLIDIWKIHKVVDVRINRTERIFGFIPRIQFADKGSYTESSTKQYDMLAFRYLSWALFPLLGGYAVYALMYLEHRGWYSFVLNMLYGFLLTFGFIMMTPQLFINYKMKSVAHLPWRMLSYKFLNTFIDDIFAFVIKMPIMYRIGCFRDDIVFLIFLYQRYIYKTDPTRVNEFGFSAEMEQEAERKKKGEKQQPEQQVEQPMPAIADVPVPSKSNKNKKNKSNQSPKSKDSKKRD